MVTTAFGELPPSLARLQSPQSFRRTVDRREKHSFAWHGHCTIRYETLYSLFHYAKLQARCSIHSQFAQSESRSPQLDRRR